ncbi:MAG: FtsH protease activity modulator HflK [Caulobacteraceae bacterium]
MPWNDNANPGPWGSPQGSGDQQKKPDNRRDEPGRRRGPPPLPPGNEPPEWARRINDFLRGAFGGGGGGPGIRPSVAAAFAGAAVFLWAASGLYIVNADEEAVVSTLGAYTRTVGPGVHYHAPSPIERVEKQSVTGLRQIDIGGTAGQDSPAESLMLTGDENIVDMDFSVQWRVNDIYKFAYNVRDQQAGVRAVAESAMREVVGRNQLQPILTNGRGRVQDETRELMQKILDSYDAGVTVVEVQIKGANPPPEVVPSYQSLAQAGQQAQSLINQGNTFRNRVVNEAKGDAARITQNAEGYREQVIRQAQGQAARFNQLYAQYQRAPQVTRDRMYIETMERVLARVNKVIVDGRGTTAPIILPPDIFRPRAATPAANAPQAQNQGASQ